MKYRIREIQVRTSKGEVTRRTFRAYVKEGIFWWRVRDGSGVSPAWSTIQEAHGMILRSHNSRTSYRVTVDHEVSMP